MWQLIKLELYKIAKKRLVLIGLVAILLFQVMMFLSWGTHWSESGSIKDYGDYFKTDQEYMKNYEGKLTDKKLLDIYTDLKNENHSFDVVYTNTAYMILTDTFTNGEAIKEPYKIKDRFSTDNGYESDVANHLTLGYTYGTSRILFVTGMILLTGGFLLIVALSSLFSDEYSIGMDALILSSRYGKNKAIHAKLLAAAIFESAFTFLTILVNVISFTIVFGTKGWNASIQLEPLDRYSNVPFRLTFKTALFIMIVLWVVLCLSITMVSCMISSIFHSSFTSIIVNLSLYLIPAFLGTILINWGFPEEVANAFPIRCMQAEIPLTISKYYIWILVAIHAGISSITYYLTYQFFKNHQVK